MDTHQLYRQSRECRDREIVKRLLCWFTTNRREFPWRRGHLEPWQVIVVEIMLQQTNANRVAAIVPDFFRDYPTLRSLVEAEERVLVESLGTLGLQNRRAKSIVALARALLERAGRIPTSKRELEQLPGVGPYVAAAYMSTVLEQPAPMVDVNMARFVERLYGPRKLADIRHDPKVNGIAKRLIDIAGRFKQFNWAVMDLGAVHCKARHPSCSNCPLLEVCDFGQSRVCSP